MVHLRQSINKLSLILLVSCFTLSGATQELTPETFKAFVDSGKNGMVKFYQSWCGHCMRMKPDWDQLADQASESILIADVDCGKEEGLCGEVGVAGYPTIKYYKDGKENDYSGGRSFESLSKFVEEELASPCTFNNESNSCSERALKYIKKWSEKTLDQRKAETKRLEGLLFEEMKVDLKKWVRERVGILKSSLDEKEL